MKKTLLILCVFILSGSLLLSGCGSHSVGDEPSDSQNEAVSDTVEETEDTEPNDGQTVVPADVPEGAFEATVFIEGEELQVGFVRYDSPLGYSMDFPYAELVLSSEGSSESFRWHPDDVLKPKNSLTVEIGSEDAQSTADRLEQELYYEYYIVSRVDSYSVNDCSDAVKILCDSPTEDSDAAYDNIREYYLIPFGDGCFVVTVNYTWESTEGAYQYMLAALNTFTVN